MYLIYISLLFIWNFDESGPLSLELAMCRLKMSLSLCSSQFNKSKKK